MQVTKVVNKYGYTLDEIACKIGYKCASSLRVAIANKNGKPASPNLSTLRAIAEAVGCSVGEFFDDEREIQQKWNGIQPKIDIRRVLRVQGITAADLAIKLGVSERQIKNILSANNPCANTLYNVARALNVPITALFSQE